MVFQPSPDKAVLAAIVLGWLCLVPREGETQPHFCAFLDYFTCLGAETSDSRALEGFLKVHGSGSSA